MDKDSNEQFIRKTESLVRPQDVTSISFLGDFNKILPLAMQEKIMKDGSVKVPYMGFIVDPYCLFLAYRIKDIAAAAAMLPEGYELASTRIFADESPCPLIIMGAFAVRTSAFIGNRLECYLIARHKDTGRISWIIADYETNTNSYDPKKGFCGYSASSAILTTSPHGDLVVDFEGKEPGRILRLRAELEKGQWARLDRDLWVEGNMSIDYGGNLASASSSPFSLVFDPFLMEKAQRLPLASLGPVTNTYLDTLTAPDCLVSAAVFPWAQHFIIKQDLPAHVIADEKDLEFRVGEFLEARNIKLMSGDDIKKPLIRGMLVSTVITWGLIIGLALKVFLG